MSVLVYGSGVAALSAVRTLLGRGIATTLVSPSTAAAMPGPAEGGISDGIDAGALRRDTLACGDHRSDPAAIEGLAEAAAGFIDELCALGVPLSNDRRRLPGHRSAGAAFVETITALQIARALETDVMRLSRRTRFERVEQVLAHAIRSRDGRAVGLVGIERATLKPRAFASHAIILAPSASAAPFGDPIVDVALESGARMVHGAFRLSPSILWGTGVPLSSSLVAEGARYWVPSDPEDIRPARQIPTRERRFLLERRFPDYGSFAPSDLAARALYRALKKRRRTACHLDLTHLPEGHLRPLVGRELSACAARAPVEPYTQPLLVAPGVSGSLSGLDVDAQHRTTVAGLFAAGAAAARYHGACPLEGNVLLADLHGGRLAALACDAEAEPEALDDAETADARDALDEALRADGELSPREAQAALACIAEQLAFGGEHDAAKQALEALRAGGVRCGDSAEHGNRRALAWLSLRRQLALCDLALRCHQAATDPGDTRSLCIVRRVGDESHVEQRIVTTSAGPRMIRQESDG